MKRDFSHWLALLGDAAPVKTLTALRAWNDAHRSAGTLKYGQSNLDNADEIDLLADRSRYEADRRKDLFLTASHGIDEVMKAQRLDALIFPAQNGAGIAARAAYPTVIVPFATVPNTPTPAFPAGFRSAAGSVWCEFYRDGVQRAAVDCAGICVRAGQPPSRGFGGPGERTRRTAVVPLRSA